MGTLTSLLNLSHNALANAQAAIDMTGTNIANQGVAGYARRTANFSTMDSVQIGGNSIGMGASITITAQRDRVLEQRVNLSTQTSSAADARLSAMRSLQSIFSLSSDGTSDAAGVSTALSSLFNSFTSLQSDPTGTATRQAVLSAAQSFAQTMNSASAQIAGQTTSINQQVSASVTQVNSLLTQIAAVNGEITKLGSTGDAGSLEDQRTALLTQLSSYIDFQQISTENNGIGLAAADGTALLSGSQAFPLSTAESGNATHILSADGKDLTSIVTGGSIGGMLSVRDNDLVAAQNSLDTLAYSVASAINTQNQAGITATGSAGSIIFNLPSTAVGAASTLSVAFTSVSGIAAASSTEGATGTSNAAALAALASSAISSGETPATFLASLFSSIGSATSIATGQQTTASAALTQTTTQRDALSAVSLDEEAANLTQFQRSYQAAAKVFNIVDQILASAINLGTDTAVS